MGRFMAGETNDVAERVATQLGVVCAHLDEIRRDLLDGVAGSASPLEEALAAVRSGDDVAGPLDVLHAMLQADGDPQGLNGYGQGDAATRSLRPVGIAAGAPGETVYVCPLMGQSDRCARYWWPQGAAPVPTCSISGSPLHRDRI